MKLGRKKEEREKTKMEQRVSKMATADLHAWSEQALYAIGSSLSGYRRAPEHAELLEEALLGSQALTVVIEELSSRNV